MSNPSDEPQDLADVRDEDEHRSNQNSSRESTDPGSDDQSGDDDLFNVAVTSFDPDILPSDDDSSLTCSVASSDSDDPVRDPGTPYKIAGIRYDDESELDTVLVDPFLTSIKVWMLRSRYDFMANLKHTEGPGLEIENHLRFLVQQLKLYSNMSIPEIPLEDKSNQYINYFWMKVLDINGAGRRLLESNPDPFANLHTVTTFSFVYACECPNPVVRTRNSVFFHNQRQIATFNTYGFLPDPAASVLTCQACGQSRTCDILLPPTTWALIFHFNPLNSLVDTLEPTLLLDSTPFVLAFTSYHKDTLDSDPEDPEVQQPQNPGFTSEVFSHLFIKDEWFRYSATSDHGQIMSAPGRFSAESVSSTLMTSVYLRRPPLLTVEAAVQMVAYLKRNQDLS
jgi:hypothetical protein